ncbi:unnamed protein product, partial [Rotaria sp. Silwood2]
NNGILNFDVNNFDEGYVGPFTWHVKRLATSINLICYSTDFSDKEVQQILKGCAQEYLKQVYEFCEHPKDQFALTLKTTSDKVKEILNETRIQFHAAHLGSMTYIENYDEKCIRSKYIKDVDDKL